MLIVDDQPEIRRLLAITLGSDYEIIDASDGTSALAAVRQHRPKAVLLDIMMPGEIDGLQVLASIKSDPVLKSTQVAMITARGQVADYRLGQELGADAYFIKPFSPLQVVTWMREKVK
ncbi:MAG: response regulator [Rhodoferax sp.]